MGDKKSLGAKNRKHNWFYLNGDIRINKKMTTTEFSDLISKSELEFVGFISHSEIKDEDYE